MQELKTVIARNIIELRRSHGMTQLDLAEKLNYTDKAISKWERGESLPDIAVLKTIADLFGVKLDYLVSAEHVEPVAEVLIGSDELDEQERRHMRRQANHRVITWISIALVWALATLAFVVLSLASPQGKAYWLAFLYAIPVSAIVWLVLNSLWFTCRRNFLIITLLMWSILTCVHVSCISLGGPNVWLIYILGIPGQIIILMWSRLRHRKN